MSAPPLQSERWPKSGHNRHAGSAQSQRQLCHQRQRRLTARSLREGVQTLNYWGIPIWMR